MIQKFMTIEEVVQQYDVSKKVIFDNLPIYVSLPKTYFYDSEATKGNGDACYCYLEGIFQIKNNNNLQFDTDKLVALDTVLLVQDGKTYSIAEGESYKPTPINEKCLRVSDSDLMSFMPSLGFCSLGKPEPAQRHVITMEERKSKSKSAIQLAVEAYLDTTPDGNKAGFYTFLKAKLKLTTEEILKDGEPYPYYFKEVKESGIKEGVYLNHPKEGKKVGKPGYNHYSGDDISSHISREKGKKNKMTS